MQISRKHPNFQKIPRLKERGHFCNYWIRNDLRIENSNFGERSIHWSKENLAVIWADAFEKADFDWRMAARRLGQGKKQRNYDACPLVGERTPLAFLSREISNKPAKVKEPFTGNKRKPRLKFSRDDRNPFKSQVRTGDAKQTAGT